MFLNCPKVFDILDQNRKFLDKRTPIQKISCEKLLLRISVVVCVFFSVFNLATTILTYLLTVVNKNYHTQL